MAEVQQRRGIWVVFLVANTTTSGDQQRLETEHEEEGDIVQCGVKVKTLLRVTYLDPIASVGLTVDQKLCDVHMYIANDWRVRGQSQDVWRENGNTMEDSCQQG